MIKKMIIGQLDNYHLVLQQRFFFGEEIPSNLMPIFEINKLVDDVQNRSTGYTFLEDPCNGFSTYKEVYGIWLLSDQGRRRRFTYHNGTEIVWKPKEAIEMIKSFKALDQESAPGIVFSAGPSSCGTEFSWSLFRQMPGADHNLGLALHNVSLNATTDKSSHQQMIDRFVPHVPT